MRLNPNARRSIDSSGSVRRGSGRAPSCARLLPLAAALLSWTASPALSQDIHAYIPNSGENTMSVIDTATDEVIDTIVVGEGPQAVHWHPDGDRIYVGLNGLADGDNNQIAVIDPVTRTVITHIEMTHTGPEGMAFSPDGRYLYVATAGIHKLPPTCGDKDFVTVIDTTINEEVNTVQVLDHPWDIGVLPDGGVWVANAHDETLTFHVAENETLVEVDSYIPGDGCNVGLDFHTAVFAERPGRDEVWSSNMHNDTISRYQASTREELERYGMKDDDCRNVDRMCEHSMGLAWDHTGDTLFIGMFFNGEVRRYDGDTMKELGRTAVGETELSGPKSFQLHPDGIRLYVGLQGEHAVEIIDIRDMTVINRVDVGLNPIPFGEFIGTVPGTQSEPPLFADDFESGDSTAWDDTI